MYCSTRRRPGTRTARVRREHVFFQLQTRRPRPRGRIRETARRPRAACTPHAHAGTCAMRHGPAGCGHARLPARRHTHAGARPPRRAAAHPRMDQRPVPAEGACGMPLAVRALATAGAPSSHAAAARAPHACRVLWRRPQVPGRGVPDGPLAANGDLGRVAPAHTQKPCRLHHWQCRLRRRMAATQRQLRGLGVRRQAPDPRASRRRVRGSWRARLARTAGSSWAVPGRPAARWALLAWHRRRRAMPASARSGAALGCYEQQWDTTTQCAIRAPFVPDARGEKRILDSYMFACACPPGSTSARTTSGAGAPTRARARFVWLRV